MIDHIMEEEPKKRSSIWLKFKVLLAIVMLLAELSTGYFSFVSPHVSIIESLIFFVYALFTYGYLNLVLSEIRDMKNAPWYLEEIELGQ